MLLTRRIFNGSVNAGFGSGSGGGTSSGGSISSASVGDIVLYNKSTKAYISVSPNSLSSSAYPLSTYHPIGIVAIPASHNVYGNGKAGVVSYTCMDIRTATTGFQGQGFTTYRDEVQYQYPKAAIGTTQFTTANYTGTTASPSSSVSGQVKIVYMPSDSYSGSSCPTDSSARYSSSSSSSYAAPSPYNSSGGRNSLYYSNSSLNVLSDFAGKANTEKVRTFSNQNNNWQTSDTVSFNTTGWPAAECVYKYMSDYISKGTWYVPAMGELGYVIARRSKINESIAKIHSVYSSIYTFNISSDYGYISSTEYDSNNIWHVYTKQGSISSYDKAYDKGNTGPDSLVVAFMQV